MKVKSESEVAQLCPTLCDPIDGSPPGFSVHGIFQAGALEWGAIAFSGEGWSQTVIHLHCWDVGRGHLGLQERVIYSHAHICP